LIVKFVPKYLNSSTLSQELLSIFILWLRPAFWSRDMTMYLMYITTYNLSIYIKHTKITNNHRCPSVGCYPYCAASFHTTIREYVHCIVIPRKAGLWRGMAQLLLN
jgi:hypothetical protein